ncbi:hypothetical protein [Serratia fonticola]|uniref:Cap15 family cyclic dinucleotide receptor domain-containing protein n=1 Tax=Serratia fonticola TaxID=47917 RepID=UPI00192CEBCE|nr:hypothetical protein [Serratia fonticola]MBL5826867.1 hypothetical protein [Serratia fonticola]
MINLIPIRVMILIVSVLYAATILVISHFSHSESTSFISYLSPSWKLATILNIVLWLVFSRGWRCIWRRFPSLNEHIFPDLNGKWKIKIHWVKGEEHGIVEGDAWIKQSLINMSMGINTQDSESETLIVQPQKDSVSGRPMIYYIYKNTPKNTSPKNPGAYEGTALLKICLTNKNELNGNYYTNRASHGYYILNKVS